LIPVRYRLQLVAHRVGNTHGLRNEMHFSTKWLQIMFRCIRHISGKAAHAHHCHQTSGVNNTTGEADSCEVVISLRNPWVALFQEELADVLQWDTARYSTIEAIIDT